MAYIFGSIWDRPNRNALNNLSKSVEQQGKSIQDLVADGQLTPTQYAELISIVNGNIKQGDVSVHDINKNLGKFDETYLSDELLNQISGDAGINVTPKILSIESAHLNSSAVTPTKTSFAKMGRNKFDGIYYEGLNIQGGLSNGVLGELENGLVAIFPVEGGKTYTVSKENGSGDRFRIATHGSFPKVGEVLSNYQISNDTINLARVTLAENENHIIVYVSTGAVAPPKQLMVEEGVVPRSYAPPKVSIDFEEKSIESSSIKGNTPIATLSGRPDAFNIDLENQIIEIDDSGGYVSYSDTMKPIQGQTIDYSSFTRNTLHVFYDNFNNTFVIKDINTIVDSHHLKYVGVIRRVEKTVDLNGFYTIKNQEVIQFKNGMESSNINLFEGLWLENYMVQGGNGVRTGTLQKNTFGWTAIQQVEPNKKYAVSVGPGGDRFRISVHNRMPVDGEVLERTLLQDDRESGKVVDCGPNDNYIIAYLSTDVKPEWFQIQEDSTTRSYVQHRKVVKIDDRDIEKISTPKFVLPSHDFIDYKSPSSYIVDNNNPSTNTILSIYEGIMNRHSDYVSKHSFGTSSEGQALNYYKFTPAITQDVERRYTHIPKVILVGGTHGHEHKAAVALARFAKDLADEWRNSKLLEILRWNVEFIFVPVLNTYGIDNNQRTNKNGVDINRNFESFYKRDEREFGHAYYQGPNAFSEPESEAMRTLWFAHLDADLFMDHHNYDIFDNAGYALWFATDTSRSKAIMNGVSNQLSLKLQKDYEYMPQGNVSHVTLRDSYNGGLLVRQAQHYGIPSVLYESTILLGNSNADTQEFVSSSIPITIYEYLKVSKSK